MKTFPIAILACAAALVSAHRPAFAMVEFCPASLSYERVGSATTLIRQQSRIDQTGKATNQTSSLYGFELYAMGPRTITQAKLAFDTGGGWYTVDVSAVTLVEKDRHYSAPWVSFVRRDYVSPVYYVRFPQSVSVAHAYVYVASAQNDGPFGWQARGVVQCDPYAMASQAQIGKMLSLRLKSPYRLDPKDDDDLSAPPSPQSLVISASLSQPLETGSCPDAFKVATVKTQTQPRFPDTVMRPANRISTAVEVAIEADGTLADAWVWGPSSFPVFDDEAVRAAKASTYTGSAAYCRPVPGFYFFRVTFDPNG